MDKIVLESYGKINLFLDVLYKREDNYHELRTVMQEIKLSDTIEIEEINKGIEIQCNNKDLPLGKENLVYRAWEEMKKVLGEDRGVKIYIDKRIPIASGLAGGSSNAAQVLKGLNQLWELNLSQKELMDIGLKIGADVPFCIMGGTAYAKGVGEELRGLKSFSNKMILLANPEIPISTVNVYNNLDLNTKKKDVDVKQIIQYIEEDNLKALSKNMYNIMEELVMKKYPIIAEIKEDMLESGALGSLMSGSGATVFGIFDDEEKLKACAKKLDKKVPIVIATETK